MHSSAARVKTKSATGRMTFASARAAAEHQNQIHTERRTMYILRLYIRLRSWLTIAPAAGDFSQPTTYMYMCAAIHWPVLACRLCSYTRHSCNGFHFIPRTCMYLHFLLNVIFLTFDFSTAMSWKLAFTLDWCVYICPLFCLLLS